ncbi:MAG: SPFH domain-containing protein [Deltaproteobacteria bacterium]|nr:SPFH domain-containing protein [Deltaproteobacteria bacterium]
MGEMIFWVGLVVVFFDSVFIVRQRTAVIIERFGKFNSVRFAGLKFKLPFIDRKVRKQNLRIIEHNVDVETKTLDNVFVNIQVSVQYKIKKNKVAESYYELEDPFAQIKSYVFDTIRSEIPKMKLDDVFSNKEALAVSIKDSLSDVMEQFGYQIINSLVTDIQPEMSVKNAMNKINATEREKIAAANEAEAQKIKLVKVAEAEAESKRLQGQGLANQRTEIARGIKESIQTIKETGVDEGEVMTLLLVTQHYDAIQDFAKHTNSNSVLMNYSPGGISDVATQIREAVLSLKTPPAKV